MSAKKGMHIIDFSK